MSELKTAILGICIFSVMTGAVSMLLPKGALSKPVRTLFGILIVVVTVSGVSAVEKFDGIDFGITQSAAAYKAMNVSEMVVSESERRLESSISDLLQNYGVACLKINVSMDISDENSISISKIYIETKKEMSAKCRDIIISEFMVSPEIKEV